MEPAENRHQKPVNRPNVIAGVITAVILVTTTIWLVILLF